MTLILLLLLPNCSRRKSKTCLSTFYQILDKHTLPLHIIAMCDKGSDVSAAILKPKFYSN